MKTVLCAAIISLACACGSAKSATTARNVPATPFSTPVSAVLHIGQTGTLPDSSTITIKQIEYPVQHPVYPPSSGNDYAYLVEECAGNTPKTTTVIEFNVFLDNNTAGDITTGTKQPSFVNATLNPGECDDGWLAARVPDGRTPMRIKYQSLTWSAMP